MIAYSLALLPTLSTRFRPTLACETYMIDMSSSLASDTPLSCLDDEPGALVTVRRNIRSHQGLKQIPHRHRIGTVDVSR
jgi:hypothetical protein